MRLLPFVSLAKPVAAGLLLSSLAFGLSMPSSADTASADKLECYIGIMNSHVVQWRMHSDFTKSGYYTTWQVGWHYTTSSSPDNSGIMNASYQTGPSDETLESGTSVAPKQVSGQTPNGAYAPHYGGYYQEIISVLDSTQNTGDDGQDIVVVSGYRQKVPPPLPH